MSAELFYVSAISRDERAVSDYDELAGNRMNEWWISPIADGYTYSIEICVFLMYKLGDYRL